jgi:HKD family nuclease
MTSSRVTFGPITNKRGNDTGRVLAKLLGERNLGSAALASAYLTRKGWGLLRPALEKAVAARGRTVRLLVGIKDYFSEPRALEAVHRLVKASGGRLQARISRNPRFHAKAYLFERGGKTTVIAGSANLTSGGLRVDGELSIQVEGSSDDPSVERLQRWFDDEFVSARVLDREILDAYRRARPDRASRASPAGVRRRRFLQILQAITPESGRRPDGTSLSDLRERTERIIWHAEIGDVLSKGAEKELREDADWYRGQEPALICYSNRPASFAEVKPGDKILVFDFSGGKERRWACPATVRETHDYPPTEGGRFFLVLRYARKGRRKLTRDYVRSLLRRGFARNRKALHATLRRMGVQKLLVAAEDFGRPLGLSRS